MSRVPEDAIRKLNAFIDSLPEEARGKCALCNETLTHFVKQAEAQTGAGTATVTRALAEKINETAAPADRVSGRALERRVNRNEGKDVKIPNRDNKTHLSDPSQPPTIEVNRETGEVFVNGKKSSLPSEYTNAFFFAKTAVRHLEGIAADDPKRFEALDWIIGWCEERKQQLR